MVTGDYRRCLLVHESLLSAGFRAGFAGRPPDGFFLGLATGLATNGGAMSDDWPFCECGVTLLDGEDECSVCAASPHGRDCPCDECETYWDRVCRESAEAAEKANRRLVCSCGWTGAFIEHHNSEAYGGVARAGCEIVYRYPADERQQLVRKAWTGAAWQQVGEAA